MTSGNRENEGKKIKTIAIIGRARGGKSFFTSRFVENRSKFVNLFCGNNIDKTVCPVHVIISEDYKGKEKLSFYSNFKEIYQDNAELADLGKRVESLRMEEDGEQRFDEFKKIAEIEAVIREIKKVEETYRKENEKCDTYIEIHQDPSDFCKEILKECNLKTLKIVDTPGVSGKEDFARIAKSDLYMFLVKPDNEKEAQTLYTIVKRIKGEVATSKVAFLYKKEGLFLTPQKYEKARNKVKKDMAEYSKLFEDLKGNIIATQLDILDPANHCILFPTMDEEEVYLPEELFLQDIKGKLVEAFSLKDNVSEEEVKKILEEQGEDAKELIMTLMNGISPYKFGENSEEYTLNSFRESKHNRVKTGDRHRLSHALDCAYFQENDKLDTYFSQFTVEIYPEQWKQIIIKYVYEKLIESVKQDRGLGYSSHAFEDQHFRTMFVVESILADKVYEGVEGKEIKHYNYREALRSNAIESSSWGFVYCKNDDKLMKKLEIIKECLLDREVSNLPEMVLCRYVGGLRKQAQYNILKLMGYSDEECMVKVKELPF